MAKDKTMRWIAFRVAGVATAIALSSLALVASPAAATTKNTTTTVTATSPAFTGAPIVFTATVTHLSATPTGTVTFTIMGADSNAYLCDGGSNTIMLSPAGTGSSAQCSISAGLSASASPYAVTAVYSGDPNFSPSTGTLSAVVKKGHTTTAVTSASNPTVTGQPVSFTATVAPVLPSTGVPTGTVTFSITGTGGSVPCDGGTNTVMLDGSDMAQCSVAAGLLAAGSPYTVSAAYSGDTNYAASTGTTTQDVSRATATIGVTSSVSSPVSGQPISFTATITGINPPGMGTPTGSIVFSVVGSNGTNETCQGGDTVPLSGSSAACNFPAGLPASALNYTVSATLQDPNYKSPVAGTLVQAIQRGQTQETVSNWPSSIVASQSFTFDVTFKTVAPATGAPTGQFEWAVCPNSFQGVCTPENGTKGGTFNLPTPTAKDISKNMNKVVVPVTGGLTAGFYNITALYVGNSNLGPSSSNEEHILVIQVPTTLAVSLSHNPIVNGGRLRIRVGVIADSRATDSLGAPSGTVTFGIADASGDRLTCIGNTNTITISTTSRNQGLAKCKIASGILMTTESPYTWKVTYSGDTNYATSSAHGTLTVENPVG
jgi:large repetitive protein